MEARYEKARYPREVDWWESQICRGRESRKAQGAPRRGSSGSSRWQTSYCLTRFSPARSLPGGAHHEPLQGGSSYEGPDPNPPGDSSKRVEDEGGRRQTSSPVRRSDRRTETA